MVSTIPQSDLEHILKEPKLEKLPAEKDDVFEASPPTPPTLIESPVRTTLKRFRHKDDHDSSFIPKRQKNGIAEGVGEGRNTVPLPVVQRPTRPPNAVASSSKNNPQNLKQIVAAPEHFPAAPPPWEPSSQMAAIAEGGAFVSKQIPDKFKGKGKAVEIPSAIEAKAPPHINLHRQSSRKRLDSSLGAASWRSSVLSARTRTSSTWDWSCRNESRKFRSLRQSVPELDFSDDGKLFVFRAAQEIAKKMAEMARDHGVSTEMAMRTYTKTGSMETTKFILEHFHKTLLTAQQEIYERM